MNWGNILIRLKKMRKKLKNGIKLGRNWEMQNLFMNLGYFMNAVRNLEKVKRKHTSYMKKPLI